jgi:hypothetical protein
LIDEHHKATKYEKDPLVEAFRKGDLSDFSLGLITFGLPLDFVSKVQEQFPNNGFHWKLSKDAFAWFSSHPLTPPPFLKW